MYKRFKKGFTIVELVIVIAVIAILAAVLVPTFSSIVNKAKNKKDISFCVNINKELFAIFSTGKAFSPLEAFNLLFSYGYEPENFVPSLPQNYFVYDEDNRKLALLDEGFKVLYSDGDIGTKLWVLISSQQTADAFPSTYNVYGFLLMADNTISSIVRDEEVITANNSNIQQVINNSFSLDTIIEFNSDTPITEDITIEATNELTLDLAGKEIVFSGGKFLNLGTLNLINGKISTITANSVIENYGIMTLKDVEITYQGENAQIPLLDNNDNLKLIDCTMSAVGMYNLKNAEGASLDITGGAYSADCASCIENQGILAISGGTFLRKANETLTGSKGSVFAVINNFGTNATTIIKGGTFVNENLTLPRQRGCFVLYNKAGSVIIHDGTFENRCDNKNGNAIYLDSLAELDVVKGVFIVANQESPYIKMTASYKKENIIIRSAQIKGTAVLNEDKMTVMATSTYYDYSKNETPNIFLTNETPNSYEARINNNFYSDVNYIDVEMFSVGTYAEINKSTEHLKLVMDREYLGVDNSIIIVYAVEMPELVLVKDDFVLCKTDKTHEYENAYAAYLYYSDITEQTASFEAVTLEGIKYFAYDEFELAVANASKITLLKDIKTTSESTISMTSTQNVTFDLNGKKWEENGNLEYMFTVNYSFVYWTIEDSSTDNAGTIIFNSQNSQAMFVLINGIIITGGNFISNTNVFYIYGTNEYDGVNDYSLATFKVTGGNFVGGLLTLNYTYQGKLMISGGTFTFDPTLYLESGYTVTKIDDIYVVSLVNGYSSSQNCIIAYFGFYSEEKHEKYN